MNIFRFLVKFQLALKVGAVALVLFLLNTTPPHEGIALLFAIAFLLIYILLLIRDMDDPFRFREGDTNTFSADVNPSQLYELMHSLEPPEKAQSPSVGER